MQNSRVRWCGDGDWEDEGRSTKDFIKENLVNCKPIKNKLGDDDVDGDDICIILFQP